MGELEADDHVWGDSAVPDSYDLLATIARLESSVEQYREWVAGLEQDLDTRSQQLDVAMRRNNTLTAQLDGALKVDKPNLELVVKQLNDDVAAARDNAKQLAADLEYSRHSVRMADYRLHRERSMLASLTEAAREVDLDSTAAQLRDIAQYVESLENLADARLLRRAGNILLLLSLALRDWQRQ